MSELDEEIAARLAAAGRLLRDVRRGARLSQRALAARAGINERTVRRIEGGSAALLNSYWPLADVLGLPLDWFVRPGELAAALDDGETAARTAEASIDALARSGWFGPAAMTYLREYVAFARGHGGPGGPADAFAAGARLTLARSRTEADRRTAWRR